MTPAEINIRNAEFWARQATQMDQWMADGALRHYAVDQILFEQRSGTSIRFQRPLEELLATAAPIMSSLRSVMARRAASATRADALQTAILSIVDENPRISCDALFRQLRKLAGPTAVIRSVGDMTIEFSDRGHIKSAPISGLKDRLTRARSKFGSR